MDISIPYYEDMSRISNSNIGWFLNNGPSYLHKKLTGVIPDETGPQLEKGTMIHEFILQPEEFSKDYLVIPRGVKSPASDKQESFCKSLINTVEIEPIKALLSAYKANYSIVGKSEGKMLVEATEMANNLKEYIELIKEGKKLITSNALKKCVDSLESIQNHKFASTLLNNENWTEFHEFHINWEYNGLKCKSLLDCVKFDYRRKICQLIDLKTTVKLWHFEDSMKTYDYLRQLCFYKMALMWYLKNECNEDVNEWNFEYYIVAIDSTSTSEIRVFEFTEEQVTSRKDTIENALEHIKWHTENNLWDHSLEYYKGNGCESIDL